MGTVTLKKQAAASVTTPPTDYDSVFIDTDGVPKYKDESGVVHTFSGGDFSGPASAADGHVVVFDGTTGKLGKDGGALGTAAFDDSGDFATAAQGAKADSALQPNTPITGATKTKITYDADGLVTAGADATTADIADSTNKRYVTDAQLTVIGNTSGTNTGDQTSVTGNAGTATALQTARTIDGQSFNGTANITVIAPGTHAATSKATPVDADELPLVDSAASNVLKKLTWANLKATVKTYFDTLYAAISHTHSLSNLTQSSATTNQVPQWNGSAWVPATVSGGGGGSPGGSDKQMQFNDAGAFGGCSVAYWDAANGRLSVGAGTSPAGKMHAKAGSASEIPMIAQGTTSQTGSLQEWRDSSGTVLAKIMASGACNFGMVASGPQVWVGGASYHGSISLRGDPAATGQYGIGYDNSTDGTTLYGYTGRKFVLGMRDFNGTYRPRFTYDDASGVKTWTHDEAINYIFGTTTGTKLGTSVSQKLSFWGTTPVVQPASASQAAVTGTAGGTYTSTEQTLISDLKTLVNQLRADLVTVGIIKGSA